MESKLKVLLEGTSKGGLTYDAKIEDGKIKIAAELDISALIDMGADAIPGDSPVEQLVVTLIKTAVKAV